MVLAELLELAPAGVEEAEVAGGVIEYAVYGAPGELPSLPDLKAAAGDALVEISTSETADDWQERWKQFHPPVLVKVPSRASNTHVAIRREVPDLRVRPPWEQPSTEHDAPVEEIVIDPGQAFGTGAHASTRMCLELLLGLAETEPGLEALLDVGSGSGVLAIAAARLGYRPVLALDHERESVEAASANAALNGVEIEVRRFDLRSEVLPWLEDQEVSSGPIVVLANLLRPLLLELSQTMSRSPTHLIASGLLREQVDEVVAAFTGRFGLRERRRLERDEWAAVWLTAR